MAAGRSSRETSKEMLKRRLEEARKREEEADMPGYHVGYGDGEIKRKTVHPRAKETFLSTGKSPSKLGKGFDKMKELIDKGASTVVTNSEAALSRKKKGKKK